MPILLVSPLFLNGCVWFTFALSVTDIFVLVTNALGILLGTIQFLVYLKLKNSTPEAGELGKDSYEKQIETRVIDIQDSNVKSNNVSTQNRTLTRLDVFPVIRSPSLSPNRSPSNKQHEDDTEQWCELKV
ncbi:putative SWEET sugar transporter [Helianthus annuus]|uniref:SWEET sugar transporter n=1 Tax=Helianthus annuus TaxID=4232 RepID=A0A9K3IJW6_HELAN|nr:putative SWEET sugar transporter [Helianthus annuus]KAJ0549424.1 putative SWEET sugar transporter [Helianthus annuus]KAJ0555787.1 putative SWEET sugar transporter [Helianthus annuus]KAJ0562378.1 putative SWEET sugar transporter [Helianthus annuus]KAJ0903871.1 putative SWEET sugar transporter [Helianthus annuus]